MPEIPPDQQVPQFREPKPEDESLETRVNKMLDLTVSIERDRIIFTLRRDSRRNIPRILKAIEKGKNISQAEEKMITLHALPDEKIKNIVLQERANGNDALLISFLLIPVWEEKMKWETFTDEEPPDAEVQSYDDDEEPLDDVEPELREGTQEVRRILHEIDKEHPELEKLAQAVQKEKILKKYTQLISKPFIKTTVDYVIRHSPWFGKEYNKEDFMSWIREKEIKFRELSKRLKETIDPETGQLLKLTDYEVEEYRKLDAILAKGGFQQEDLRRLRTFVPLRSDIASAISVANRALADILYGATNKDDLSKSENMRSYADECYTGGREKLPDTLKRIIELYKIYEFIFGNPII